MPFHRDSWLWRSQSSGIPLRLLSVRVRSADSDEIRNGEKRVREDLLEDTHAPPPALGLGSDMDGVGEGVAVVCGNGRYMGGIPADDAHDLAKSVVQALLHCSAELAGFYMD